MARELGAVGREASPSPAASEPGNPEPISSFEGA
jgi:hypothetical protein